MTTKGKIALGITGVLVLLCGTGGLVALRFVDYPVAAAELPRAIKEAKAVGIPMTADELDPPKPTDNQLGAELVLEEFSKGGSMKSLSNLLTQMQKREVSWEKAESDLKAAQPVLAKLNKLAEQPRLVARKDYDLGAYVLFPEFAQLKAAVKLLASDAMMRAHKGQHAVAVSRLQVARRLGAKCDGTSLIGLLVNVAIDAIILRATEYCLAEAATNSRSLVVYSKWLESSSPNYQFRRTLKFEAYMSIALTRNLDLSGGLQAFSSSGGPTSIDPGKLRRSGEPPGMVEKASMARVLQYWTKAFRYMLDGPDNDKELTKYLDELSEAESNYRQGLSRLINAVVTPVYSGINPAIDQARAHHACILALARVLEFKAKTGSFPKSLKEAGAEGMDPFVDKPLQYRSSGTTARVWSVGRDGVQNNGLDSQERPPGSKEGVDTVAMYPPVRKRMNPN